MKSFCCLVFIISLFPIAVLGQTISIGSIKQFPDLQRSTTIFPRNSLNELVQVQVSELTLLENGIVREIKSINCPERKEPIPFSLVFAIDVSGSMSSTVSNGQTRMDVAIEATKEIISNIPTSNFECAITSFDTKNYLLQDFTSNKVSLLKAVEKLSPQGGTSFNAALIEPPSSALQISKKAKNKRAIILLTDGYSTEANYSAIIEEAQEQDCSIYIVCLQMQVLKELELISNGTNGKVYDKVQSLEELKDIYLNIFEDIQQLNGCTITWESTLDCKNNSFEVSVDWQSKKCSTSYTPVLEHQPTLSLNPIYMYIPISSLNTTYDTTIFIKAVNSDFTVSSILSSNPDFTISPTTFILKKGDSIPLTVTYTPFEDANNFTEFSIVNDICPQSVFVSGGNLLAPKAPKTPILLVQPNGNESLVAGTIYPIRWKSISPRDTVAIEYSTNGGYQWTTITDKAAGLEYLWTVPATASDSCLVRVKQYKNSQRVTSNQNKLFSYRMNYCIHSTWDYSSKFVFYTHWILPSGVIYIVDVEKEKLTDSIVTHGNPNLMFPITASTTEPLIATGDTCVYIYSYPSKNLVTTLKGVPDGIINSLKWSPDGKKLAIGMRTGELYYRKEWSVIYIYDTSNWSLTDSISIQIDGPYKRVTSITWNPNSQQIAFTGFDSLITIYDLNQKNIIREIDPVKFNLKYDLQWSPDGQSILATGGRNDFGGGASETFLYNVYSGNIIARTQGSLITNKSSFNPVGNEVAQDSSAGVIIRDAQTLERKRYYNADLSYKSSFMDLLYSLHWSPDGTKILGTSTGTFYYNQYYTHELIIWEAAYSFVQEDMSDSLFSIVVPSISAIDIDMGKVLVNNQKDSIIYQFIRNTSNYPVTIDSIKVTGIHQSNFVIFNSNDSFSLPVNSDKSIEIQFAPKFIGLHIADIEVYSILGTKKFRIRGEGIQDAIAQATKIIDFGTIDIFTKKDSLNVTTISAVSATPIQVTNARIEGGAASSFAFLTPFAGNATITSTDTLKLDLQFFAQSVGRVQSQLILDHTGVGSPSVITLFGNGRDTAVGNLRIVAPELTAKTNNFLKIPIYLENLDNVTFSSNAIVDFNLRFNSTILTPRTANAQSTITNGERSVPLSFPLQPDANGVIGTIEVHVGLGNASSAPLTIDSVRVRNSQERIGKRDGLVTLIDICEEGGTRLVNSSTKVGLALMSANPVSQQIELKLTIAEIGNSTIQLFDSEGKLVSELLNGTPIIGETYLTVKATNFPNGTYFLVLKTPTVQETIPFIIQR